MDTIFIPRLNLEAVSLRAGKCDTQGEKLHRQRFAFRRVSADEDANFTQRKDDAFSIDNTPHDCYYINATN